MKETPEAITFTADVPGMKDDDLTVEVDEADRVLTVRGKREDFVDVEDEKGDVQTPPTTPPKEGAAAANGDREVDAEEAKKKPPARRPIHHRRERHFGSFENRYSLPLTADVAHVKAVTEKGVLTVTVPKLSEEEAEGARGMRKIEVSRQ